MLPIHRCLTLAAVFAISASVPCAAQVGGGSETLYEWIGGTNHYLGDSVSNAGDVNGDGFEDIIILAPLENDGVVRVLSGLDGSELHNIVPGLLFDNVGSSVSGTGDVNADGFDDFVIGHSGAAPGGLTGAGSASVYSGVDGSLLYQWTGVAAGDGFGCAVSDVGDLNQDGYDEVLVGAEWTNLAGMNHVGSVFVYSGIDGSLLFQWDGAQESWLGESVSGAGDVDSDGIPDVIAGAPGASSAFVYSGANGATLHSFTVSGGMHMLGQSVSDAGDIDQDGFADVIIGAFRSREAGKLDVGSAHVYSGVSGAEIFSWHGRAIDDLFGYSVSSTEDANGDGIRDLIVGASQSNPGGVSGSGYVNLYSGADGVLLQNWQGEASGENFGESVSGLSDIDGDGLSEIIIGARFAQPSGLYRAGSASVMSFKPYLNIDHREVSAAAGGVLNLSLDFPDTGAGYDYRVLISATGVGPITVGVEIPLSIDRLVRQTKQGNYPFTTYSNLQGSLDSIGDATASISLASGLPPSLIGRTFWLAAVVNQTGQLPEYSSVAVSVQITP